MVEGSMPFEAKTNSRGLAAPKGLDLPLLCSAVDAAAPADLGFNYSRGSHERVPKLSQTIDEALFLSSAAVMEKRFCSIQMFSWMDNFEYSSPTTDGQNQEQLQDNFLMSIRRSDAHLQALSSGRGHWATITTAWVRVVRLVFSPRSRHCQFNLEGSDQTTLSSVVSILVYE
jgi:hypothetical protein